MVELFGKGLTVERTITLDGKKDYPYHVVGERDRFAVTWGPFTEQKKIQVVLYWTDRYSNGVEPIDDIKEVCSTSLGFSQLIKYFHCLCIYSGQMTRAARKSLW